MLDVSRFYDSLKERDVGFFAGVPDSLLKSFCAYVTDHESDREHIIAANEGSAVGLACGYHLATGRIPLVYMQNSGMGNAVNPLASLTDDDVYGIPLILVIGWRGQPGVHDEPQHVKQGKITCPLLDTMGIRYVVLADNEKEMREQMDVCFETVSKGKQFAFVVKKDTFEPYQLQKKRSDAATLTREESIETVVESLPKGAVIVSTTGMASRELYEIRDRRKEGHDMDFLTVGSMGHASQIALGIALQKPGRQVFCIDGDGAMIMHMGSMATIGSRAPKNFHHIIINNNAHDSVGGQPTVSDSIDIQSLAKAVGYCKVSVADDKEGIRRSMDMTGPSLLEIKVKKGARKDLGRPKSTPKDNKTAFMKGLR